MEDDIAGAAVTAAVSAEDADDFSTGSAASGPSAPLETADSRREAVPSDEAA